MSVAGSRRGTPVVLVLWWVLTALVAGSPARADGPHIAFHGTAGGYAVTLFSAPDPLLAGPAQLTLLVQDAASGAMLPAAQAHGQLALSGAAPVALTFTPGGSGTPQLLLATVPLPRPGAYALQLEVVAQGKTAGEFTGVLPVAENNGKRNTVLWAVFLPGMCVALFLANQYGKAQLRRARAGFAQNGNGTPG